MSCTKFEYAWSKNKRAKCQNVGVNNFEISYSMRAGMLVTRRSHTCRGISIAQMNIRTQGQQCHATPTYLKS